MKFTYNAYKELLEKIVRGGYEITDYHLYSKVSKPCILRHDVDMSLEKAVEFAEMESKLDGEVRATYFILITSDFYNPFSKSNIKRLKRILNCGHEIGLHFDEKKYMNEDEFDKEYLIDCVGREVELLSQMIETPVQTVSMHRPSKQFIESELQFTGIVNSYAKTFFREFKYLSDSRKRWREDVEQIVEEGKEKALHILTHPFWYGKEQRDIRTILEGFIAQAETERYLSLRENFTNLDEVVIWKRGKNAKQTNMLRG